MRARLLVIRTTGHALYIDVFRPLPMEVKETCSDSYWLITNRIYIHCIYKSIYLLMKNMPRGMVEKKYLFEGPIWMD
jgi:hypothetical protein